MNMLEMMLYWSFAILMFITPATSQCNDSYSCWETQRCSDHEYALSCEGVYCCPYYYDLLEAALLNNSTGNLYRMRRAFFPDKSSPSLKRLRINVNINMNETVNESCDKDGNISTFNCCDPLLWRSVSNLNSIANAMFFTTLTYEGIIVLVWTFVHLNMESYTYSDAWDLLHQGSNENLDLDLNLVQLKCNPENKSTEDVVTNLMSWVSGGGLRVGPRALRHHLS